ncbi:MAG: nucleoside-triphosphatase [Ignavibacteriaceae bacterium]
MKPNTDSQDPAGKSLREYLLNGKRIIIFSGEINSGKTSRVEKLITLLGERNAKASGVYSKGIYEGDDKTGYELISIQTGEREEFAMNKQTEKYTLNQGRYWFDRGVFAKWNKQLEEEVNRGVIIIDEVGPLELKEGGFHPAVKYLVENHREKLILITRKRLIERMIEKYKLSKGEYEICESV